MDVLLYISMRFYREARIAMDSQGKIKQLAMVQAAKAILRALPTISEERLLNIPFVQNSIARLPKYAAGREFFKSILLQGRRAMGRCSKSCFRKFAENLIVNEFILANSKREDFHDRHGFDPPFFFVLSPSMRCNLNCHGCYAGEYGKEEELSTHQIHRLLNEARDLGIYFITLSGGEPFIRPDLLEILEVHEDMYFQVYTNGTFLDSAMARTLSRLGNVLPIISVEGWEKETDARRGPGAFARILSAMANLREEGVLFGFSATATRQNNELISRDEFVRFWADQGCFIGWFFNYIPIGKQPALDLMPTPKQRIDRRRRLTELRSKMPIILADFWNDGPLVGGCIAGDRYLHINNRGDVEPCVFVHFAVDNIKEKSLTEILHSEFFQAIRRRQPYSSNYYRPCMVIDHPHVLRAVINEGGAQATHPGADHLLRALAGDLDRYAAAYGKMADALWEEEHGVPSSMAKAAAGRRF